MMSPMDARHRLDRTVSINAAPEVVFRFFTDTPRWAAWWGPGSAIDARPGGRVTIRHQDGTESLGEIVELDPPRRIVFTYGYATGTPFPPGASTVEIRLEPRGEATTLRLSHRLPAEVTDADVQGWRYQLSLFANVVANEAEGRVADAVDAWFAAWSTADTQTREAGIRALAAPEIRLRDRFSAIEGLAELLPHLAAVHRFMPGLRLSRDGQLRHCQGTAAADWVARTGRGDERARGTTVFVFGPAGAIEDVTSFWNR